MKKYKIRPTKLTSITFKEVDFGNLDGGVELYYYGLLSTQVIQQKYGTKRIIHKDKDETHVIKALCLKLNKYLWLE